MRCTLGLQLGGQQAQFTLIRASLPEDNEFETPVWTRLSTILRTHPVKNPNENDEYSFYMKTYSENEGTLEQLVAAGVLEVDASVPAVEQGYSSFPLVKVKIPLSQMAKACSNCERWELCESKDDEATKRMKGCSKCKSESKAWYCNQECQLEHWKEGYPPHRKVCGK